jgi:UDP-2,3-diacylglucosamine hydrolase
MSLNNISNLTIKDDAIFIADSHYNKNKQQLKYFLNKLEDGEIVTTQLFLMGDIFDFLSAQIDYFIKQNQEIINILNILSNKIEIVYLEGNHDYNLKELFPNIFVIPREKQPLYTIYNNKKIAISHGDIFTPFSYNLYTFVIRNRIFLIFLNLIDIKNWLTTKIDGWLLQKDICSKCNDFQKFSKQRIDVYPKNIDLIIEGHFHYGQQTNRYINIPSLVCQNGYYSFKNKIQYLT